MTMIGRIVQGLVKRMVFLCANSRLPDVTEPPDRVAMIISKIDGNLGKFPRLDRSRLQLGAAVCQNRASGFRHHSQSRNLVSS